jgi:NTP pyrophosphatase (non-canonical NTP hydrolase)
MQAAEYQRAARTTALYPASATVYYTALGLVGETGVIANKVKKIIRGDVTLDQRRDDLKAELGDVLWYVSGLASDLGLELRDIAAGAMSQGTVTGDLYSMVLKLNGRAGKIAEIADDWKVHGVCEHRRIIINEHLWHVINIATAIAVLLGTTLEEVCHDNIKKLFARKEAGTIKGDGDKRCCWTASSTSSAVP